MLSKITPLSPRRYYRALKRKLSNTPRGQRHSTSSSSPSYSDSLGPIAGRPNVMRPRPDRYSYDDLLGALSEDGSGVSDLVLWLHEPESGLLRLISPSDKAHALLARTCEIAWNEGLTVRHKTARREDAEALTFEDLNRHLRDRSWIAISLVDSRRMGEVLDITVEQWTSTAEGHLAAPSTNMHVSRVWNFDRLPISLGQGLHNLRSVLPTRSSETVNFDVDWVFTWVNGEDPDWLELFKKWAPEKASDASDRSRFEHRDDLKFALRSLDQFAPWIRRIHVVSNCKPPAWLNLSDESKVSWVDHDVLFSKGDLPTFSSHAIETTLHKIPGISEHFVYSNDDFYLAGHASPEDFFAANGICKTKLEPFGMVNGDVVSADPDYLNAARNSASLIMRDFGSWPVRLHTHSPQALRTSILKEMEERYTEEFSATRRSRFRSDHDIAVTGFLFHHYAFVTGRGIPVQHRSRLIQQNHNYKRIFGELIREKSNHGAKELISFCVNDGGGSAENTEWNAAASKFLFDYFPQPSSFEV